MEKIEDIKIKLMEFRQRNKFSTDAWTLIIGPGIKHLRFVNYELVEELRIDEYTFDQALTRLEQIRVFRK